MITRKTSLQISWNQRIVNSFIEHLRNNFSQWEISMNKCKVKITWSFSINSRGSYFRYWISQALSTKSISRVSIRFKRQNTLKIIQRSLSWGSTSRSSCWKTKKFQLSKGTKYSWLSNLSWIKMIGYTRVSQSRIENTFSRASYPKRWNNIRG